MQRFECISSVCYVDVCIVGSCYNGNHVTILSYYDAMWFYRWDGIFLKLRFSFYVRNDCFLFQYFSLKSGMVKICLISLTLTTLLMHIFVPWMH